MPKIIKKKEIRLQIKGVDGQKPNLTFKTQQEKNRFKTVAKRLVHCYRSDVDLFPQDITWLNQQTEHTRNQLRQLGIVLKGDNSEKYKLNIFLDNVLRNLKNIGDDSSRYYNATAKRLISFFGSDFDIRKMSKDDAEDYVTWLVEDQKLNANSTARRQAQYASTILSKAVDKGLLQRNVFQTRDIPKNVLSDESKKHYINAVETQKIWNVLNAKDDQLRFVLMRYLGLRSPSEQNELRWKDFDWTKGLVRIRSPKLIRHERKYIRYCPFQLEKALPVIKAAYDKRQSDYDKILPEISHKNLYKHVKYWLAAAGIKRWPKLLNNFRGSAATDFRDVYSAHLVSAWLGHSETIAKENYLMAHEGHVADVCKVKVRNGAA